MKDLESLAKKQCQNHMTQDISLANYYLVIKEIKASYLSWFKEEDQEGINDFLIKAFDCYELAMLDCWESRSTSEHLSAILLKKEEALSDKNRYLALFESIPLPMILLDRQLRIDNLNFKAKEIFESVFMGSDLKKANVFKKLMTLDYSDFFDFDFEAFANNPLKHNEHTTTEMNLNDRTYIYSLEIMKMTSDKGDLTGLVILFTLLREVINT
jgi:PAS domain-containing protein